MLGFSLENSPPPFVASVFCLSLGERSTDVRSERWRPRQRAGRQLERRERNGSDSWRMTADERPSFEVERLYVG